MAEGPLEGLLVLSLEQAVAAPYCSSRLADAGARVIKVERAEGDFARHYDHVVHGESSYFIWLNRGKESLTVDIKNPRDVALLQRIIARADVFIQNLAPGAAARAGFDSAQLRKRHPRLVTCDISGYGDCDGFADMKAYDLLVQAESGLCSLTGSPEAPGRMGVSGCDIACGMYATMGVMEALYARERSGIGSAVDTSLFGSMAEWMAVPLMVYEYGGKAPLRTGLKHPMIQPYGAYQTRGGAPILIAIQNEREFADLCREVLQRPELPSDPRFHDNPARLAHVEELDAIINGVFTDLPRQQLLAGLKQARVAYGELNDVAGLAGHPALRRICVQTPSGPASIAAPGVHLDARAVVEARVPAIGEHSAAIRAEFAPS